MRRKNKFYFIWAFLLGLALFGWGLELMQTYGFSDLNAFAEFVLPGVFVLGSFVIFVFSIRKWYFSSV